MSEKQDQALEKLQGEKLKLENELKLKGEEFENTPDDTKELKKVKVELDRQIRKTEKELAEKIKQIDKINKKKSGTSLVTISETKPPAPKKFVDEPGELLEKKLRFVKKRFQLNFRTTSCTTPEHFYESNAYNKRRGISVIRLRIQI